MKYNRRIILIYLRYTRIQSPVGKSPKTREYRKIRPQLQNLKKKLFKTKNDNMKICENKHGLKNQKTKTMEAFKIEHNANTSIKINIKTNRESTLDIIEKMDIN